MSCSSFNVTDVPWNDFSEINHVPVDMKREPSFSSSYLPLSMDSIQLSLGCNSNTRRQFTLKHPTWVLTPLANHSPAIFSVSSGTEELKISPPRQTKSPNNSNMLHMFNNNIYTDFRAAYKHVLFPSYITYVI